MFRLSKCKRCGRLFSAEDNAPLCDGCSEDRIEHRELIEEAVERWNLREPSEIAAFAGISVDEATEIIRESSILKREIDTSTPCKMCKKAQAQTGSDFCLQCRIMLNHAFGNAATAMAERAEEEAVLRKNPLSRGGTRAGVVASLEQKRSQAPGRRFTPKNRYSS